MGSVMLNEQAAVKEQNMHMQEWAFGYVFFLDVYTVRITSLGQSSITLSLWAETSPYKMKY